jgi:putative SOS response-associated peptidase YedK
MRWGLPAPGRANRKICWTELDPFSELAFGRRSERPRRCLILLDSFALPAGPKGKRTRSWIGLWDEPIFAWAGLWREVDGVGAVFMGAVTKSNPLVARVGPIMPAILRRSDCEQWLFGNVKDALGLWRKPYPEGEMWLEQTDELWSTGASIAEIEAIEAFRQSEDSG